MNARIVAALAIVGAALYYVSTRQQQAAQVTVQQGRAGGLGQLGAQLGSVLSAIPGIGPLLGAGAAVGGAAVDQYNALPPDQQRQIQRWGEKLRESPLHDLARENALGRALVGESPRDKRRDKRAKLGDALSAYQGQTHGLEDFALRQLGLLSRPDVARWEIDQSGTTHVWFTDGNKHMLAVPYYAEHPAGWAFEATSRIYGAPTQAGVGPVTGDFYAFESGGFADENFYAGRRYLASATLETEGALKASIARKH